MTQVNILARASRSDFYGASVSESDYIGYIYPHALRGYAYVETNEPVPVIYDKLGVSTLLHAIILKVLLEGHWTLVRVILPYDSDDLDKFINKFGHAIANQFINDYNAKVYVENFGNDDKLPYVPSLQKSYK